MKKNTISILSSIILIIGVMMLANAIKGTKRGGFVGQASPKTLYDLAKEKGVNGKYTHSFDATDGITYPNMEEVAKRSDAIVVGRPMRIRNYLSGDGTTIKMHCWIKLQEILKGDINRKRNALVLVPGGSHMYDDKTVVLMSSRSTCHLGKISCICCS